VTIRAVAEIVSDLSLCPPASSWSDAAVAQFSAYFAPEEGDSTSNAFDYELFLDFLFFPVQQARPQLEISLQETSATGFPVGIYRQVTDSRRQSNERRVVVKEVALPALGHHKEEVLLLRDAVNRLRLLSHPNLVRICLTLQCKGTLYVLQTHEPKCCSLRTILESFGPMKESTVRRYLAQILQGLSCLHSHGVPHGALSTQSVLIDSCGLLKLADFGVHRYLPGPELWIRPPETPSVSDDRDWCFQFKVRCRGHLCGLGRSQTLHWCCDIASRSRRQRSVASQERRVVCRRLGSADDTRLVLRPGRSSEQQCAEVPSLSESHQAGDNRRD